MATKTFTDGVEWNTEVVDSEKLNTESENDRYLKQMKLEVGYQSDDATNPNGYVTNFARVDFDVTCVIPNSSTFPYRNGTCVIIASNGTTGVITYIQNTVAITRPSTTDPGDFMEKMPNIDDNTAIIHLDLIDPDVVPDTADAYSKIYGCHVVSMDSTTITVQVWCQFWSSDINEDVSFTGTLMVSLSGKY